MTILVVGQQNTYRSIIAAECLKKAISLKGKTVDVRSAGIMAFPDIPAEQDAVTQLGGLGIFGEYRSTPLGKAAVLEAGLILTVTARIKAAIVAKFPDLKGKIFTFGSYFGGPDDMEAVPGLAGQVSALLEQCAEKLSTL